MSDFFLSLYICIYITKKGEQNFAYSVIILNKSKFLLKRFNSIYITSLHSDFYYTKLDETSIMLFLLSSRRV